MFGEFIKTRRLEMGLTLRKFCNLHGEDPSNWSKLERGVSPAPGYARVLEICQHLGFSDDDPRKEEIFDLADADKGRIPKDIMNDPKLVGHLPALFRTLRGDPPTEEELMKLADLVREAHTDNAG
ncbi:helix-turn-helix domain-containing protein [Candidatus Hydrogenedentota bacterium]